MATSVRVAELSPAKATLLAAHFAASADIRSLRSVCSLHPSTLHGHALLRVLLCLPETMPPSLYLPLVRSVLSGDTVSSEDVGGADMQTALSITTISEKSAQRKTGRLPYLSLEDADRGSLATSYLLQRSRNIDSETGALSIVKELLTPFQVEYPGVGRYLAGAVEVLSRLVYEYAQEEDVGALAVFETLEADVGVKILLNHCGKGVQAVHDLEVLVVPYLNYKENDWAGWDVVWAWLGKKAESGDWTSFVEIITKWDGPESETLREQYTRFAIAGCYTCRETSSWALEGMRAVERKAQGLVEAGVGCGNSYKAPTKLGGLLDRENPLTVPNTESLKLLDVLITSARVLSIPLIVAARLKLEGSYDDQKAVLVQYVRNGPNWTMRSNNEWKEIRRNLRSMQTRSGVLEKLTAEQIEKVLLSGMLEATKFSLVKEIYVTGQNGGLGREEVERGVLDAFQDFYDKASNGNRTRGSIKNALSALQILYPHYSKSTALERASRLVAATDALSYFSLTITPGVLLRPVNIRIHADPLSLLARLLDSNAKSYTQADNLITIAKDLCFGTTGSDGGRKTDTRVLGMCAEAALSESDFETAYSLTMDRFVSMSKGGEDEEGVKDVIWRTCFQVGRYHSPYAALVGETTVFGWKALRTTEMRMELLAQALRVCPPSALAEVLAAWQRCEKELQASLKEREEEEHHTTIWKSGGGAGTTASRRKEDEAPMDLFAVARGAAQAISGSAFPLSAGRGIETADSEHENEGSTTAAAADGQRTRKRDMVSEMVTHRLASGLGWVLGAQPNVPLH